MDRRSSKSVDLSWAPPLEEERSGIITNYVIVFNRRGSDSLVQLTSTAANITLNMLSPFTAYTVTVAASTAVGVGPPSPQLTFTTAEDGKDFLCTLLCSHTSIVCCSYRVDQPMYLIQTVPTGPPFNPSGIVIDSRTLSLAWEEPPEEDRNGIIRQYHINMTEVNTGRQFQVVSTTTSIAVSSLHPDYTYRWTVAAFTIGLGPFSTSETISTPEDGGLMTSILEILFFQSTLLYDIFHSSLWGSSDADSC